MFSPSHSPPAKARRSDFAVVCRLGPRTRDAMVAAAAEMALADGHAEAAEHRGLLAFLKQNKMLLSLGRAETNGRYAAALNHAAQRHATGENRWPELTETLRPLAGMEAARLVAGAAAFVAAANGVVHPRELELLRSLHSTLRLNPDPSGAGA